MLFLVSQIAFAYKYCSTYSYESACKTCTFDASGNMDSECKQTNENNAKDCLLTKYPDKSAMHADGQCPDVDKCIDNLKNCTGVPQSDQEKCNSYDNDLCYWSADVCVEDALKKCGRVPLPCNFPSGMIILVVGFAAYISLRSSKAD